MFGGNTYIGYLHYIVILFIASGVFILYMDATVYKDGKMMRERKAALISAWLNLTLGVVVLLGSWVYTKFLW
ncbi:MULTISPECIES: CLC_0170 family protein [Paenibacillus]|jgi:hypothetical protein|uniref:Uncharacterized protein n=1 Tax=Paenibacillus oceani TaxID=2772510 RepID=A0A927CDR7_9BACL|nr:CLC_0170 family protein [Paenibacillus oceani]MBD2863950.1 hypothetical protein [Paenibacillus oceani]MDF2663736.1 hypothetical protein [Paenibacillus sp.]